MKKISILLTLVLTFTFAGGFYAGIAYIEAKSIKINPDFHHSRSADMKLTTKEVPEKNTASSKVLMGYVQDYHDPDKTEYNHLSHVIFSFAHPSKNGDLLMSGDYARENLRKTVRLAHEQNTKVLLAVGGWFHISGGESYPYFKQAISNGTARTKLVDELIKMVKQESLDGVDIDFEHPRSQDDAEHLAGFIRELNTKLEVLDKELSIAVYSKVDSVTGQENKSVIFLPSMFEDVDYVNIMAYDGHWDGGYNAANLSPYPYTENVVRYWSELFDVHGLPKDKLVLGVPFYAQPEEPSKSAISYSAVIKKGVENAGKDTVTIEGITYHYNGKDTIQRKTELALNNEFGGMMLWEAGHDARGEHSLTKAISDVLTKTAEKEKNMFWAVQ
ncbi:glycoside hydrolase family 18 protein [Bacillus sp. SG-1]|uniref:glycoside hydrolase family 18 protein n=1 Tax=Bacillus sp. SG-1 TaxID=161544 RepID=UPI00015433E4|nr:glycoside hydrolase family 18 protein [Bacillus sp. SG-1]EDL65527.1 Chitinase [Bacillus sp. SG-1]